MTQTIERRQVLRCIRQKLGTAPLVRWKMPYSRIVAVLNKLIADGFVVLDVDTLRLTPQGEEFVAAHGEVDDGDVELDDLSRHQVDAASEGTVQLPSGMRRSKL